MHHVLFTLHVHCESYPIQQRQEDASEFLRKLLSDDEGGHNHGLVPSLKRVAFFGAQRGDLLEYVNVWRKTGCPDVTFTEEEARKIELQTEINKNAEENGDPSRVGSLFHSQTKSYIMCLKNPNCPLHGTVQSSKYTSAVGPLAPAKDWEYVLP